jgi:DNA-binding beta-propeller fold protein YncE
VIDGATNIVARYITVGSNLLAAVVEPRTNRILVTNVASDTVLAIEG